MKFKCKPVLGLIVLFFIVSLLLQGPTPAFAVSSAPVPLISKGKAVDWWFVFKFNTASFPECGDGAERTCPFGGEVKDYRGGFSQQFVYASSASPALQQGKGCAGTTTTDPIGATFGQVYNGDYYYMIWNDQFYNDPKIKDCSKSCGSPWGHSKGMLAWDDNGNGFVMQVSTPSWPASGSAKHPRKTDGNTLGCVDDDDVEVSQHFFSLKLTKDDLIKVLKALKNASVVTDPVNKQIVNNGGPADVQNLVNSLGVKSKSSTYTQATLSTGVKIISKPSKLETPPWQFVSSVLGGTPLRSATWWANPKIYTTTSTTKMGCWNDKLTNPGPVEIATTGSWNGVGLGLKGGEGEGFNHAKIGVSIDKSKTLSIFGDMNQQGALEPDYDYPNQKCSSSQNGRGGTFYILDNAEMFKSLSALLAGETASTGP